MGRIVPPTVYYDHVNKLVSENDLEKNDTKERGRPSVFYSLNKEAKRTWRLNIHRLNPESVLFRKIYERLFFYEFEGVPAFIIPSEQDFDKLLQSEFNTTREKLDWVRVETGDNYVVIDELYSTYSYRRRRYKKNHEKQMKDYWKGRGQITFEEVEFICQPIYDEIDVKIIKTEYWEINKNSQHKRYAVDYRLILPGVATSELVGSKSFNREVLEKATSLLIKEGILMRCMVFRNETRYKIADQRLRHMIDNLRDLHYKEFNALLCNWEDFEAPTNEEKERTKWLLGEQESQRLFRSSEIMRYRHKQLVKTSKTLEEYYERYFFERERPVFMTAENCKAYLNGDVKPHFQKPKLPWIDFYFYGELEHFNRIKNPEKKNKGSRQNILEFHKYRKERLVDLEAEIAWDAECLKKENVDVLEEYKFLHNAIRMVCPLVFEPPDPDLKTDIPAPHWVMVNQMLEDGNADDFITFTSRITGRTEIMPKKIHTI
ncbi:MAG: hypothetical protein WA364_29915 [Candidatus Nitrosopolaris sp.]